MVCRIVVKVVFALGDVWYADIVMLSVTVTLLPAVSLLMFVPIQVLPRSVFVFPVF